jgi:multicomponent Na+:H+ antiporter subunit D
MHIYSSNIPLYTVLVSLGAVVLILVSSRTPNLREAWTIMASVIKFALVFSLLPDVFQNRVAESVIIEIASGLNLTLRADPFGLFFALVASGLWILTSFYSIGYMRGLSEHKQTRYFASFALCLSATVGIAFAADLLTFVIFYEILTIATYPLVIHKESAEAISAGRKYLAYTLSAGVLLIVATVWLYNLTGNVGFHPGGSIEAGSAAPETLRILFFLFLAGVSVKAAVMPLHGWLPTAMVAPTPVSALLHAVAVVKAGVFGVVRVIGFVFGPDLMSALGLRDVVVVLAGSTIVLASLIALNQNNLKRRLAYSTIGHLSYVVLGASLLSSSAFTGSVFHIAAHATMKITLFFCAGAIYVNLHKENVSELDGVGRIMPWTMGAFSIAAIGLAGIPPLNGFVSKWYLGLGAVEGGDLWSMGILLLSGILNVSYLFPIVYRSFFLGEREKVVIREASPLMVVPLVVTAGLSLVLGLRPNVIFQFFDLAQRISLDIFSGGGL